MLQSAGWAPGRYFEVDFDVVTRKKAAIIDATPALCDLVGDDRSVDKESGRVESSRYCLFPADLRDLPALQKSLVDLGFDFSLPTLVLSECVLVYMDPRYSQPIVQWAGAELPDAVFVIYEQIHPEDAFGQQMLINLESRGCPLKGIQSTPSLEAQKHRFISSGWQKAEAFSMDAIYRDFLPKQDLRRIEKLEIFDEFEEWHMIQGHYCITYGVNDSKGFFKKFGFRKTPEDGNQLPNAD
uniref:Leucine carboxyl methyltransferase 1 homolog n=1 Tax=Tetraselmis sp. GSL018 TaxID=582737 RepID=A0A061SKM0_9CHLO